MDRQAARVQGLSLILCVAELYYTALYCIMFSLSVCLPVCMCVCIHVCMCLGHQRDTKDMLVRVFSPGMSLGFRVWGLQGGI